MFSYIVARMKEPSSYAGLSVLLGLFGAHIAPEQSSAIVTLGTAIAGALAVFVPQAK